MLSAQVTGSHVCSEPLQALHSQGDVPGAWPRWRHTKDSAGSPRCVDPKFFANYPFECGQHAGVNDSGGSHASFDRKVLTYFCDSRNLSQFSEGFPLPPCPMPSCKDPTEVQFWMNLGVARCGSWLSVSPCDPCVSQRVSVRQLLKGN